MEEWQQSIVRMEEHTRDMKESLKDVATKECVENEGEKTRTALPTNGIKDKLLWVLVVAMIVLAGVTSAEKIIGG